MDWIADLSFAHNAMTGAILEAHSVPGVIAYVSDNPAKNATAANLADWLTHGRLVGLVFEDNTDDMRGGAISGDHHGWTAVAQAQAIGYDLANCVVFAADDENTTATNWPAVLAYMDAFAVHVPHPGYYGDQDSIDFLAPQRPNWWYWQSESLSFGSGISRNAHLVQKYNDPRVAGLPLDASDIHRTGVPFMGDDMFTDQDRATLQGIASEIKSPAGLLGRIGANLITQSGRNLAAEHADFAAQLAIVEQHLADVEGHDAEQIAADVVDQLAHSGNVGGLTTADIVNALLSELAHRLGAVPGGAATGS